MDRHAVSTEQAPPAIGPYSQAIVAGGFVFCSGTAGIAPVTRPIPPRLAAHTRRPLRTPTAPPTPPSPGGRTFRALGNPGRLEVGAWLWRSRWLAVVDSAMVGGDRRSGRTPAFAPTVRGPLIGVRALSPMDCARGTRRATKPNSRLN